jgi:hypothetical protein
MPAPLEHEEVLGLFFGPQVVVSAKQPWYWHSFGRVAVQSPSPQQLPLGMHGPPAVQDLWFGSQV